MEWKIKDKYCLESPCRYRISTAIANGEEYRSAWSPGRDLLGVFSYLEEAKQACQAHKESNNRNLE
jgi:hypothetical protein